MQGIITLALYKQIIKLVGDIITLIEYNKVSFQVILDCFDNDLKTNIENNA